MDDRRIEKLSAAIDLMPCYVYYKDTKNRLLHVNQKVADGLGVSIQDVEGSCTSKWYPLDADRYYQDDLNVFCTRQPKLGIAEKF